MAKGPAVVIIARHGARLDAADPTWHLTSPTPYDPPLTYGGWTQAKNLGLRIASLLHARENEVEGSSNGKANRANADLAHLDFSSLEGQSKPRRRHKIVIHSSPYLRCVQTSTAIAAGISQYHPPPPPPPTTTTTLKTTRSAFFHSPAVQPVDVVEPAADPKLEVFRKKHVGPDKIMLRIDAFLGEWLSPDYFEDITPPPNSTMMVASAKADLLRRGEYVEVQHNAHNSHGHFPGGWVKNTGQSVASSRKATGDHMFPSMNSLAQALPHRERSNSQGSTSSHGHGHTHGRAPITTTHKAPDHIYDPPVPSYAVSPADPIPRGYVAHARDACLEVDYQWDSMRAPQEWGDGGEYGDEWSTMHKRFRKGLGGMMSWYREHGLIDGKEKYRGFLYNQKGGPVHHTSKSSAPLDESVEDEEDLVLILVTHGAGCNALLGAVSNQPVLLDVGMASLSMAVRREEPRKPSDPSVPTVRRSSVVDVGMSYEYDMKLIASVDHLRPGVDPSRLPQPQSLAVLSNNPTLEYRRRFTSNGVTNNPIDSPFTFGESYKPGVNSSLGSMRRSSSSGSSSRYLSSNLVTVSPSLGLWSGLRPQPSTQDSISDDARSPGHDMLLNFSNNRPTPSSTTANSTTTSSSSFSVEPTPFSISNPPASDTRSATHNNKDEESESDHLPPLRSSLGLGADKPSSGTGSGSGLWGAAKPKSATGGLWGPPRFDVLAEREKGHKRRWTVTERDELDLEGV